MIKAKTFNELESLFSDLVKKKAVRTTPTIIVNEYDEKTETADCTVIGSKPYNVIFGKTPEGNFIACTCRGALEYHGCYHSLSALWKVTYLFKRQRANKAKETPKNDITEHNHSVYLKPSSEKIQEKLGDIKF
jgi:hypothetical protein